MTTITFKDGVMAGDSLATVGGVPIHNVTKLQIIEDYYVVGAAGSIVDYTTFVKMLHKGLAKLNMLETVCKEARAVFKEQEEETHALSLEDPRAYETSLHSLVFIIPQKRLYLIDHNFVPILLDINSIYSIGSGSPYALGAMHNGASALEAVEIASKLDSNTGSTIKEIKCV